MRIDAVHRSTGCGLVARRLGCFRFLCSAFSMVVCVLAFSALAQVPFEVVWKESRLTVSAKNIPLADALREVARQTSLKVLGLQKLDARISANFSSLSLRDGLHALLADVDYFLIEETVPPKGKAQSTLTLLLEDPLPHPPEELAGHGGTAEVVILEQDGPNRQDEEVPDVMIYSEEESEVGG